MSYPSFRSYIKTLRSLLKHKHERLAKESLLLSDLCLTYANLAGLSEYDKKTLVLAAHFKNLGALFLDKKVLEQKFQHYSQVMSHLNGWFLESSQLAQEAGLTEVATILEQYYHRAVPTHNLAKIFQVLNTWVACRQNRSWRPSMNEKDARRVLEQRAHLEWSDAYTVYHFIEYFQQPSVRAVSATSHKSLEVVRS